MAKQVIVLNTTTDGMSIFVTAAFWYPITTGMRPQSSGSVWAASGTSVGASAAENTAIMNGTILEEQRTLDFPVGTTAGAMQSALQTYWTRRNAQIAGNGLNQYYGFYWDGTAWAQG